MNVFAINAINVSDNCGRFKIALAQDAQMFESIHLVILILSHRARFILTCIQPITICAIIDILV
jgi:hypothetical protein